ncbi:DUF3106 domain-containing protein [Herbaspirillum autotrophicum]|uniref:DUF3106 domain-containing protein n=1 Tax=Herbaspirillum autotrophicum TaxID=180195 RepID=UPI0009F91602|nr:DUF3106 domain-containing protein [Herbaspirillum autotrophicum]
MKLPVTSAIFTKRKTALLGVALLAASLLSGLAVAQGPATGAAPAKAATGTPTKTSKKPEARRNWADLSPALQQALAPLSGEWDKMEDARKEKWLAIGNRYARMTPAEQLRVQDRMREWVKLTPVQRRAVRENYTRANKLNADQKSAQWKEYQQLSDEQKKKLSQAKLPKHVAALPATQNKAPPPIQLPAETLEQSLAAPIPASVQTAPTPAIATPVAAPAPESK